MLTLRPQMIPDLGKSSTTRAWTLVSCHRTGTRAWTLVRCHRTGTRAWTLVRCHRTGTRAWTLVRCQENRDQDVDFGEEIEPGVLAWTLVMPALMRNSRCLSDRLHARTHRWPARFQNYTLVHDIHLRIWIYRKSQLQRTRPASLEMIYFSIAAAELRLQSLPGD